MPPIQPQKSPHAHLADTRPGRLPPGVAAALGVLWTMTAAWLSLGAVAHGDGGAARLGMVPTTPAALGIVMAAGAAGFGLIRAGASRLPLILLALPVLPWLPLPVPAVLLLWTSPLVAVVWVGVAAAMLATVRGARLALPSHPLPVRAGLLALVIYSAAAWAVAPSRPGGDEPHYLIITQSLLRDRDLKIENNHARGDYREYFAGDLSKTDYLRRGRDGAIYSIHA